MTLCLAKPLAVSRPDECTWYQTFDFPDGTLVRGRWDYRGNVDAYLGQLDYTGKSVIEIGPASGFLTRAMEQRGADVLCVDTSPEKSWDVVPRLDRDAARYIEERNRVIRQLWKGWWLSREVFGGTARMIYCGADGIAGFPADMTFDIALVGSVLQHFENPYVILSHLAKRCRTIVVTEPYLPRLDIPGRRLAEFIPRRDSNDLGSWWQLSPAVVEQMMETLNFRKATSTMSVFRRWDLKDPDIDRDTYRDVDFYTHVYVRVPVDASRYGELREA